jgi:hypothetical protein
MEEVYDEVTLYYGKLTIRCKLPPSFSKYRKHNIDQKGIGVSALFQFSEVPRFN